MRPFSLYSIIALSGMMFGAQIVASHFTQSLALLVCAYHMLYNLLSLFLLVISERMSRGKTLKNTFGWARLKVLGMLVNMLFLCALCFAAFVESLQTVVHALHEDTEPKDPLLLLLLGGLNFILNIICFILIGGYTHHQGCSMIIQGNEIQVNYVLADTEIGDNICPNLSIEKKQVQKHNTDDYSSIQVTNDHKLLDLWRDTSSSIVVIVCSCVILFLDGLVLKYADAILAFSSVVVLLATTYPFIRESGLILLQSIPSHMDVEGITERLLKEFPSIQNVHDLHVWRLTASEVIATVHIMLTSPAIYAPISFSLKTFFENEGINLVTIQPEFLEKPTKNSVCILQCSPNNNCGALTCCGPLLDHKQNIRIRCVTSHCQKSRKETNENHLEQSSKNFTDSLDLQFDFNSIYTATETRV